MCRSRRELSNANLLAKFGFDAAENEPSKGCRDKRRCGLRGPSSTRSWSRSTGGRVTDLLCAVGDAAIHGRSIADRGRIGVNH